VVELKTEKIIKCPNCGSTHTTGHGYNVTKKGKFARRKCQECGTTFYPDKQEAVK